MRLALLAAALLSTAAIAAAQPVATNPATAPYAPPTDRWHAKAREIYAHAISIPTVQVELSKVDGQARVPQNPGW